ncbi:MAG: hypothetical protein ACK4WH_06875 [Phycisphaerales bacterium]
MSGRSHRPGVDPAMVRLARRHRAVMFAWMAQSSTMPMIVCLVPQPAAALSSQLTAAVLALVCPALFTFAVLARMRRAFGDPAPFTVLLAVVASIPVLNLLLTVTSTIDVRGKLKATFGRVGVFRLSPEHRAETGRSSCLHCTYNLRGLRAGVCPECGKSFNGA